MRGRGVGEIVRGSLGDLDAAVGAHVFACGDGGAAGAASRAGEPVGLAVLATLRVAGRKRRWGLGGRGSLGTRLRHGWTPEVDCRL